MTAVRRHVLRYLYPLARLYWYVRRPTTQGVKCLIRHADNMLLIKHSYGKPIWTLPGGGLKRGEEAETAVRREVREELAMELTTVIEIGSFPMEWEYKHDTLHCFFATTNDPSFTIDRIELVAAEWFPLSSLPNELSETTVRILAMAKTKDFI
jgi:8-oxo-dGTP diphosphatase